MIAHWCVLCVASLSSQGSHVKTHTFMGVHGVCNIQQLLWYTDYNRICLHPFGHAFYFGVLKDWMLAVLSTQECLKSASFIFPIPGFAPQHLRSDHALSREQRSTALKRMSNMVFTSDFSRPPECPITYGKTQTMEQMIRHLDSVLPLLFAEVSTCKAGFFTRVCRTCVESSI